MASLSFFAILISIIFGDLVNAQFKCPFNPYVCNCTGQGPMAITFDEVVCEDYQNRIPFGGDAGTFTVYDRMIMTFRAHDIKMLAFSPFREIGLLALVDSAPIPMQANWEPLAFRGPLIRGFITGNVGGVVPPPKPLLELAPTLEKLGFASTGDRIYFGPNYFENFKNLKSFLVQDTTIHPVFDPDAFVGMENVEELFFVNATFPTFPTKALSRMTKLIQLELRFDNIQNFSPDSFSVFQNLIGLDLSGNNLQSANDTGALDNIPQSVGTLVMENGNLRAIPGAIGTHSGITVLSLAYNRIGSLKKGDFPEGNLLVYLTLTGNPINAIEEGALQYLSSVQILTMYRTNLVTIDLSDFHGMNNFQVALDGSSLLKAVVVSNNDLVPQSMQISVTNTILQYVDPNVGYLLDRRNSKLDISNNTMPCNNDTVLWMSRYILCPPYNLLATNTKCTPATGGGLLSDFLLERDPFACATTSSYSTASTTAQSTSTETAGTTTSQTGETTTQTETTTPGETTTTAQTGETTTQTGETTTQTGETTTETGTWTAFTGSTTTGFVPSTSLSSTADYSPTSSQFVPTGTGSTTAAASTGPNGAISITANILTVSMVAISVKVVNFI